MRYLSVLCLLLIALLASACPQGAGDQAGSSAAPAGSASSGAASVDADDSSAGDTVSTESDAEAIARAHGTPVNGSDDADADKPVNPAAVGEEAEAAMQVVRDMAKYLVTGERDSFIACFHPESPELEEMTGMFDSKQGSITAVQVVNLEVKEAMKGFAMVDYEFSISESGKEAETESGSMELRQAEDGHWQIYDLD
ncbi:MAG: hypothetical protein H7A35_05025 [Planctomycetales bacterium]|nr:hypothetical protein [bacterium]UNM09420.1 MAG: hypothetical protein H7A35_05025 [Planctomycetales bacterium]